MGEHRTQARLQRLRARYAACVCRGLRNEAEPLAHSLGISPAEVDAHFRASHHGLDTWQPTDFEAFAALPPGRFDQRVFDQTTWWVDVLRRPHRIADPNDFTTDHLHAVVGFLEREAWRWAAFPELTDDDLINLDWFRQEATRRIKQTPLMQALLAEMERRSSQRS